MLPEEDGEDPPRLLGEEGGMERVDQARMECLLCLCAFAWLKRNMEHIELVLT